MIAGKIKEMKHQPVSKNLRTADSIVRRGDFTGRVGGNSKEAFSISQQNRELICADERLAGLQTEFESVIPLNKN